MTGGASGRVVVPAGTARAVTLRAGQTLRIVNVAGKQVRYPDGRVEFGESLARPGDVVALRPLCDVVAAVSACPMDLNPISGFRVSDLVLEVE